MKYDELEDKQKQIVDWLVLPRSERPKYARTIEDICHELDIGTATYHRWVKKYDLHRISADRSMSQLRADIPEVINTLRKLARRGSFKHTQLFLQMAGVLNNQEMLTEDPTEASAEDGRFALQEKP
jgi:transposase-like protein